MDHKCKFQNRKKLVSNKLQPLKFLKLHFKINVLRFLSRLFIEEIISLG